METEEEESGRGAERDEIELMRDQRGGWMVRWLEVICVEYKMLNEHWEYRVRGREGETVEQVYTKRLAKGYSVGGNSVAS
jgi:hypothetical protein